ncbi:murein hydrolase activator EnvC family protein [Maridesulfovibrio salexigens]|uniref:Peptidase M23 n=1 Tax=Maridesulfovibrio salexigens (strain ATCC 14822 / DSM 2638 / NCIMB 8403 / VKM B-1763) TaxID=526222 RepID=C6BSY0_MARSD|nr:peptidoglycan DD-metalloendopeptidase family protein [Maridesulfovibrio salexigens]ACS79684.1 Peptidase M23 [Maridesulfovibrio salexigens DSM 2638]
MSRMLTRTYLLIMTVALLVLCGIIPASADSAVNRLKEEIQDTKNTVKEQKQELLKLTREERSMFGELATIEDRISNVERELFRKEDDLAGIMEDELAAKADQRVLEDELEEIVAKLKTMLTKLWPVHSRKLENKFGSLDDWKKADRNFVWLASLYKDTKIELDKAQEKADEIAANLEVQKDLRLKAQSKLSEINDTKDGLLKDKLSLLAGIKSIRALKINREQELKGLLETINKLNYKLKSLTSKKIANFKGSLPRPCEGDTKVRFKPSGKPPVRGIGIQTTGNVDVKSIFWGKVVHNDTLRGFGRVVIIYHGYNYYSLYAYLAESFVKTGQEVEKDEIIGKTGYYPNLKETGLYFELRFHQKPVNPQKWLARN